MNIGILTSGGDCAGLNAVMCGFARAIAIAEPKADIFGIADGYAGLINKEYRKIKLEEFFSTLNRGGTFLGTSRQPYKKLIQSEESHKVVLMKENYRKMGLDILIILGGQGTHKTAALLASEGLKIISIPKTIDNDIFGTDVTFGFHSAMNVATECIDRIHTTAASHGRTMLVELMGNRVGWLTLYAGIAGNADIILIPEIPYEIDKIIKTVESVKKKNGYCIIAVAEGALDKNEAAMSKKERYQKREETGYITATNRIAKEISEKLNVETRVVVPGYTQRGGNPNPYDRVICAKMGAYAAKLASENIYGVTVAICGGRITHNNLADIAGKTKLIPLDHELVQTARSIGISFGDRTNGKRTES
jgi:6-phosphofructokinase 1